MGVRVLFGGIFKKIKGRFSDEDDLDDEIGTSDDLDDELSDDELSDDDLDEDLDDEESPLQTIPQTPTKPELLPSLESQKEASLPQTPQSSTTPQDSEKIETELATIRTKIDLLESHLQNIESKEALYKSEADRYMQYLTYISDKLDNLAREHTEIERLVRQ
ncbi:MAG: hypothetical protein QF775_03780 [archaeon]|jgi:chromosome segregation ATPase|nr:hypothetical protein [archaeon]